MTQQPISLHFYVWKFSNLNRLLLGARRHEFTGSLPPLLAPGRTITWILLRADNVASSTCGHDFTYFPVRHKTKSYSTFLPRREETTNLIQGWTCNRCSTEDGSSLSEKNPSSHRPRIASNFQAPLSCLSYTNLYLSCRRCRRLSITARSWEEEGFDPADLDSKARQAPSVKYQSWWQEPTPTKTCLTGSALWNVWALLSEELPRLLFNHIAKTFVAIRDG